MNKKSFLKTLEVIVSTEAIKREVYKGVQSKKYRKLGSRLYTTNFGCSSKSGRKLSQDFRFDVLYRKYLGSELRYMLR